VFSSWVQSLDIAAAMLQREEIGFTRIQGSLLNPERQRAFNDFNSNPKTNILLMTIGTGAVG
jgi:SWI/SNF-related matrix-associated actin-dependent regulator of chromatin subfamily A3